MARPRPVDRFARTLGRAGTAALRLLPPEMSHDLGIWLLRRGLMRRLPTVAIRTRRGLGVSVPGVGRLSHPVGLAAGFDKNAKAPDGFRQMGCSFVEVGTVTPRPQPGNPKPRLFREPEKWALVNRMGFNNDGAVTVSRRLAAAQWDHEGAPLGVNVGKNKDTPAERALDDYVGAVDAFRDLARYFVVNVSSPNTPGLRELATPEFLHSLGDLLPGDLHRMFVKLDPDTPKREFQALVEAAASRGFQGLIISNTRRVLYPEVGGQSGHPLAAPAASCLEWAWEVHRGRLPMIASGGVLTGEDVFHKLARGASAVQIYSALVYRGVWAVPQLLEELDAELGSRGFDCVEDAIGCLYDES